MSDSLSYICILVPNFEMGVDLIKLSKENSKQQDPGTFTVITSEKILQVAYDMTDG